MRTLISTTNALACAIAVAGSTFLTHEAALAGDALVLYAAPVAERLPDPRDAGLLRVIDLVGPRVDELPRELDMPDFPSALLRFFIDAKDHPAMFRAGLVDDPGAHPGPPFHAQLTIGSPNARDAQAMAGRFSGIIAPMVPMELRSVDGAAGLQQVDADGVPIYFGAAGDAQFIVGLNARDGAAPAAPAHDLPAGVSAVMAMRLDFQALQPLVPMLEGQMGPESEMVLGQFRAMNMIGDHASSITAAVGQGADRAHATMRYTHYREVAQAMGAVPSRWLTAADLRLVPQDATYAQVTRVNFASVSQALRAMTAQVGEDVDPMAEIERMTGINPQRDLIDHLGETVAFYSADSTGGGGILSSVMVVELSNPAAFGDTLSRLTGMANQIASDQARGYVQFRARTIEGQEVTTLMFPGLPIPLEISMGIADGHLIAALTPQGFVAARSQLKARTSLADHPGFRAMGGADLAGDVMQIEFMDTPRMARAGYGATAMLMSALANGTRSAGDPGRDAGLVMPSYAALMEGGKPMVAIARMEGDDLVYHAQMDRSIVFNIAGAVGAMGGTTGAIAAVGLLGGVMMPALGQARHAARQTQSMTIARQITMAVQIWAQEHDGAAPDSLDVLIAGGYLEQEFLTSPFGAGDDYVYLSRDLNHRFPDRAILVYDAAMLAAEGRTVVGYVDGHVELVDEWTLRELAEEEANREVDFHLP